MGCHQLPIGAHGKEGVDGSSPSEGLRFFPARALVVFAELATACGCDVHAVSTAWTSPWCHSSWNARQVGE